MLPSSGRPRPGATAIPDSVLMAVSASAPASAMARAIGRMSATFGDSLTSSGRSVDASHGRGHLAGRAGVDGELEPAGADVRAARC